MQKTFDYDAPEKAMIQQIEEELLLRTPEEIAAMKEESKRDIAKLFDKHEQFLMLHERVGNKEKLNAFMAYAQNLRKFTAEHHGWMQVTVSEELKGTIEMRFDQLMFIENREVGSHTAFTDIFDSFADVYIRAEDGKLVIHAHDDLYEMVPIIQK